MIAKSNIGALALLCVFSALGGCTETRFQSPPGDNIETCDVRWKGLWGPADEQERDSPTAFYVDDECHFIVVDQPQKGGPLKQFHVPVNFVHADGNDYVVVTDVALKGLVKIKPVYGVDPVPEKAFYFSRYRAEKDHIDLFPVDNERVAKQVVARLTGKVPVPTAALMASHDMVSPPREVSERMYNLVRWNETAVGGHFLEWEEPELVARDMRECFGSLEKGAAR